MTYKLPKMIGTLPSLIPHDGSNRAIPTPPPSLPSSPTQNANESSFRMIPDTHLVRIGSHGSVVNVFFRFDPHATAEDTHGLKEQIEKADIIVPEAASWTESLDVTLKYLSFGYRTPEDIAPKRRVAGDFTPYMTQYLRALFNSRKEIALIDIPEFQSARGSERKRVQEYEGLVRASDKHWAYANQQLRFDDAVKEYRSYLETYAQAERIREDFIMERLKIIIARNLRTNPLYQGGINMLVTYGGDHFSIYKRLVKECGITEDADIDALVKQITANHAGLARYNARMGLPIDVELIARALLELHIHDVLWGNFHVNDEVDSHINDRVYHFIASHFNLADIRSMYRQWEFEDYMNVFKARGISLPRTREDYQKLIDRLPTT